MKNLSTISKCFCSVNVAWEIKGSPMIYGKGGGRWKFEGILPEHPPTPSSVVNYSTTPYTNTLTSSDVDKKYNLPPTLPISSTWNALDCLKHIC